MTGEIEKDESPSLHVAIKADDIKTAELLIKSGANVNDNYERNHTPLHIAIGHKQFKIAKLLIESGANVNAKTENHGKDYLTPMHLAIFANTPEFIELLSSHDALINERESTEGHTPLHFAALYGNKSVIQALVDKGQNIEDIDNNGRTALFLATRQCTEAEDDSRIEIIEYLINKLKADVTKKDNNNNTMLVSAANNCPGKVVKLVIEQYVENFDRNQLKDFINHKNKAGMDALDIALNSGNEKAIEVLRSYGADIEKIEGESRLFRTVKEGNIEKTGLLLKQGANINIKNGRGLTPLDLAMQENDQDMARFLRENKAKTGLEMKVQLAALVTLTIITLGLALVVYFIVKGIQEIAAQKTGSTLNNAESTKIESPIKQK
ncbi:ankyrin repeat domain protein [Wolbachia endosymbiont of Armadillidium vulgare str. wVulC]|uniref:ankyrin repeat domain-containing protein n=1 Tax=Wolbachia endosymbiont of Armadillidium vulgare TaxID=77039 RepID=UPI0006D4C4FA|nr:ankyrin repeat domain-containing protein [Wolbachia endosymbiont of Armadillidium vulgare]KLT22078.1 ankyrin repeat domain protein [Wolbachia endosymbiont of Armadillidium vulgare str. wVulC]OJH33127.1 Phosphocholine transferase AnkX [Wolbachia endosymbiont of Armadillidium vulgare]